MDKVNEAIFDCTETFKTRPEIFKIDRQKTNNDGTFDVYLLNDYSISYNITEATV